MTTRTRRAGKGWVGLALVSVAFFSGAATAHAAKYVIVLHNAAGWQLQGADKLTVNGKPKIRHGQGVKPEISPDAYKRLPQELVGAAPLRLHRAGYLVERGGGAWSPIYPDGANFKGSTSAQALWASAQVVYQVDKTTKDQAFRAGDIYAILPGAESAAEAAVAMLSDEANFAGLGEATPAEAFDERMTMLVGISGVADGPALNKLKAMLATAMNSAIQRSGSGTGRFAELNQGLRFADVSEKAFPSDPQQAALRKTLRDKKAWVERRVAIVKAFGAASEWDALIDKYGDFEEYDDAFADLRKLHERSFKESEAFHSNEGKRLYAEKQYVPALDQIKLAQKRNPGNRGLAALFDAVRLEEATTHTDVKAQAKPVDRVKSLQVLNLITVAENYMNDGKMDQAESEIAAAEGVDPTDPRIVLTRAKLLRARKDLTQAIEMLDRYDRLVSSDEALSAGTALRAKVTYEMRSGRDTARTDAAKAEADGDYVAAMKAVRTGLQLDPNDAELLYHGGLDAAITRNPKDARQFWQNYISASQSLSSESKRRQEVLNLLAEVAVEPKAAAGSPNWFSNSNVPEGLVYDPVSLAPGFHPVDVRASKKQTAAFEWGNGVLLSVKTTSQMPGESPTAVFFDYYPQHKRVRRVSTEAFEEKTDPGLPKLTPEGAIGAGKGTWVALFNDPAVNPVMVERLTGKRVATIVTGNAWFHPFVWTEVRSFLAEYDADGRVKSAKPLNSKGSGKPLDFTWDGYKLVSIAERGGDYKREMKYEGNRLIGETVLYRGKASKIVYKYTGDRLAEAHCDADFSLDGRERRVVFGN